MNLYEINHEIAAAIEAMFDTVDDNGEVDAGTVEALENLKAARAEKLDGIGAYIKNLTAEVDAIDAEIKALNARKESKKAHLERLKEYTAQALQNAGETKFESARVVFSFRKSTTVNIINADCIPEEFIKTKVETAPDKTAIKKALQNGAVIFGAELVEKQNLQIK